MDIAEAQRLWHPETLYLNTASYGLPPDPVSTTRDLPAMWRATALAAGTLLAAVAVSFVEGRR